MTAVATTSASLDRFVHEALLYAGPATFLASVLPLIDDAVAAEQAVMVAVDARKISQLQGALGTRSGAVRFVDMHALGTNPGRIIPAWIDFIAEQAEVGRGALGIGEPVWPGRSPAELVECERHEALLNLAFDGGAPWRLVCPYDTVGLDPAVIARSGCTHRSFAPGQAAHTIDFEEPPADFERPLTPPVGAFTEIRLVSDALRQARDVVTTAGHRVGLGRRTLGDLVLAVDELVANSLDHGGGRCVVRAWQDGTSAVCEVEDRGTIADPLAGRRRPKPDQPRGRGLWLVHQLCDLVELRTGPAGTIVRVHLADHG
ncbi:MAG: hypothetical protein JWN46_4035 [Acidimicrobiales bacterium]|nr:hypothetical protein [Acidimicrobiales bacterium]